jgi:hypothetical protein
MDILEKRSLHLGDIAEVLHVPMTRDGYVKYEISA